VLTDRRTEFKASQYIPHSLCSLGGYNKINAIAYFLPYGFLGSKSKWQVNSIHCHPVNLLFPSHPVPPDKRITHSAHILVVAEPTKLKLSKMTDLVITHAGSSHMGKVIICTCDLMCLSVCLSDHALKEKWLELSTNTKVSREIVHGRC